MTKKRGYPQYCPILVEQVSRILIITLNRP
jgi:hypothetical protein